MVNKVILVGRLGQDPEIRTLEGGVSVARFSIATNESYKDREGNWQDQTYWHDVVLWRNLAESAQRNLKKGKLIYLEGKLVTRTWQDKDGNNRRTTEVVGNVVRMLDKKEESSLVNEGISASSNALSGSADTGSDFDSFSDSDDLPF